MVSQPRTPKRTPSCEYYAGLFRADHRYISSSRGMETLSKLIVGGNAPPARTSATDTSS